ncbi:class I SAM-dependent methyltransferase, partial [Thermodesulfobacteriota bacterium]
EKSLWFYRYYPGHYGSTIPSGRFIKENETELFTSKVRLDGIDLNESRQFELLQEFVSYYPEFTPSENKISSQRYYYNNAMFGFNDGFVLSSFLRKFKPAKVIEIGSGFSSALMLDTAESLSHATDFVFIDPYTDNFENLQLNVSQSNYKIIRNPIQDIDLDLFSELHENDILFVDSSHVLKIGSDLSYIFFSILPSLQKGVIVHIHDIWWPYEYPLFMINEGRIWNEIYFVRSFLQYNSAFEILCYNSFLEWKHKDYIKDSMPGYFKDTGKSLWLKKIG